MKSVERTVRKAWPMFYAEAIQSGSWRVDGVRGNGHVRIVHARTGRNYTIPGSPGGGRGEKNALSWIRKIERGVA